jgi:hypothetical protein
VTGEILEEFWKAIRRNPEGIPMSNGVRLFISETTENSFQLVIPNPKFGTNIELERCVIASFS